MRWSNAKPKIGDTRVINRFLLFPKAINNDVRWLETGHILQIRAQRVVIDEGHSMPEDCWVDKGWAD